MLPRFTRTVVTVTACTRGEGHILFGLHEAAETMLRNCQIPHRAHLLTRSRVKSTHSLSLRSRSHRVGLCTLLKLHQLPFHSASNLSPYIRFLDLSRAGIRQVFCSRPVSITSFFLLSFGFRTFKFCAKNLCYTSIYMNYVLEQLPNYIFCWS
jgi:hypothetical protein